MMIGERLKTYRIINSFDQETVADMLNWDVSLIQNIECGKVIPNLEQIVKLCDVLKISAKRFLSI